MIPTFCRSSNLDCAGVDPTAANAMVRSKRAERIDDTVELAFTSLAMPTEASSSFVDLISVAPLSKLTLAVAATVVALAMTEVKRARL